MGNKVPVDGSYSKNYLRDLQPITAGEVFVPSPGLILPARRSVVTSFEASIAPACPFDLPKESWLLIFENLEDLVSISLISTTFHMLVQETRFSVSLNCLKQRRFSNLLTNRLQKECTCLQADHYFLLKNIKSDSITRLFLDLTTWETYKGVSLALENYFPNLEWLELVDSSKGSGHQLIQPIHRVVTSTVQKFHSSIQHFAIYFRNGIYHTQRSKPGLLSVIKAFEKSLVAGEHDFQNNIKLTIYHLKCVYEGKAGLFLFILFFVSFPSSLFSIP